MNIVLHPGACQTAYRRTSNSYCENCFARFARRADTDLPCISTVSEDGADITTLELRSGRYSETIVLTEEMRTELADGGWPGWSAWMEYVPAAERTVY